MFLTIPELIGCQVRRTPDAVAVTGGGRTLSYRELDARSSRLAELLGAGPETLIGLALPRTPDLIVALLGILKSGAAYVPVDPRYPSARLGHHQHVPHHVDDPADGQRGDHFEH
jgi:non-ribosomal peptide synthetase component F